LAAPDDPRAIWPYNPSFGAAILFLVLFGITMVVHIVQMVRTRAVNFHPTFSIPIALTSMRQFFCWIIVMSAVWQFAGFSK
jgi:hypothetical protein